MIKRRIMSKLTITKSAKDKTSVIIFYRLFRDVKGIKGVRVADMSAEEFDKTIEKFNRKEIKILLCPIERCTGWRTTITNEEGVVLFADHRFTQQDMIQGVNRLTVRNL